MNPFEYLPIVAEQQHDELLTKSAQSRMLSEAFATEKPKARSRSRFVVMVKKELLYLRFTLEARFRERRDASLGLSQTSRSEGCA